MQKPCEHLARTSSQRWGSCVFLFRLGTRNLRLPTAASNHRRCTHTNTLAQTHNVSHDSLTLLFFLSPSSLTPTLADWLQHPKYTHANPPRHGDTFVQFSRKHGGAGSSFSHRGEIWGLQLVLAGFLLLQGRQRGRAACDALSQNSPALFLKAGNILFLFGVDATGGTLCVRPHVGAERSFRRSFMWWRPSIFRIHMFRESAVV